VVSVSLRLRVQLDGPSICDIVSIDTRQAKIYEQYRAFESRVWNILLHSYIELMCRIANLRTIVVVDATAKKVVVTEIQIVGIRLHCQNSSLVILE
jgi:hypothetical protein